MFIGIMSVSLLCGCLLGLMAGADAINARPQCRDSAPPFATSGKRTLCADYVSLGCCTDSAGSKLLDRYETILDKLPTADRNKCAPFARQVLCQTCSPYAAHVYSRGEAHAGIDFPGLCPDYCHKMYNQCQPLVRLLAAGDNRLLASLDSSDAFCTAVAISDVDFCYPDLLTNEMLMTQVNASSDECVCMQVTAFSSCRPTFCSVRFDSTNAAEPISNISPLVCRHVQCLLYVYYFNRSYST